MKRILMGMTILVALTGCITMRRKELTKLLKQERVEGRVEGRREGWIAGRRYGRYEWSQASKVKK